MSDEERKKIRSQLKTLKRLGLPVDQSLLYLVNSPRTPAKKNHPLTEKKIRV